ncbi:DNA methyltransferase 1-associated 1, partial [Trinorchestia longiramus]
MRRIEARKKERERKTQDLQKLIAGGESVTGGDLTPSARRQSKQYRKKLSTGAAGAGLHKLAKQDNLSNSAGVSGTSTFHNASGITESIRFPELRMSGVALRSHTLKLPASLGQKKLKAIEHLLTELNIDHNPMPLEELCGSFNDLRSDLVVMYELRTVLLNYVFELQTLKHQYETIRPSQTLTIPDSLDVASNSGEESPAKCRGFSETLDSVTSAPGTPN